MDRNRLLLIAVAAVVGIAVGSTGTLAAQRLLGNRTPVGQLISSNSPRPNAAPSPSATASPSALPPAAATPSATPSAAPAGSAPTPPSNRFRPGASDDPAHQQVVMFGGAVDTTGRGPSNDTWTWDGATWRQAHPAHSPSVRYGAALAFDADRGVVVLFGGTGVSGPLNDTWTWDGADWHQLAPTTAPPAMADPAMADYPPKHELVMYFFSEAWPGRPANDVWTWNGTTWSDAGSATAPYDLGGAPSRLAYLEATKTLYRVGHDAILAYNGSTWTRVGVGPITFSFTLAPDQGNGQLVALSSGDGTFLWNGSAWSGWAGPTPTFRRGSVSVWDSTHKDLMLFAGDISGLDTWTWSGTGGWAVPPRA